MMEHRKEELLELLLSEERIFSYEELCTQLSVSNRLLRYSIDDLNYVLKNEGFPVIEKVRGKGVILSIGKQDANNLRKQLFKEMFIDHESREILILFSILDETKKSLAVDFQDEFMVSKSAIDTDMRNLRKTCKEFDIEILSTPKEGLKLSGNEWSIRVMINNIINTNFDVLKILKSKDNKYLLLKEKVVLEYLGNKKIKDIYNHIRNILSESHELDNELYCAQMTIYFSFWKKRFENNHYLDENENFIFKYKKQHTQVVVKSFLEELNLLDIPLVEGNYLDFMVDSLNILRKSTFSQDWVKCQLLCVQLIDKMSEQRGIPYYNDSSLFENLFQHVGALLKRLAENILVYNPLKNLVRKEYSDMYEDVEQIAIELKNGFGKELPKEEIAYLSIHFSASEEKIRSKTKSQYRVIVVCGHGIATGELLAENIKKRFLFDVIGIVSSYDIHAISRLDADFVLKTTSTEIPYIPSLQVNPMLMTTDYLKIESFLKDNSERFNQQKRDGNPMNLLDDILTEVKKTSKNIDEKELRKQLRKVLTQHDIKFSEKGVQPMISDLLMDKHIKINQSVSDWKEAIRAVAQPLLEEGSIEESYVDAMINTVYEYGPYIVIGENIALAHARPEEGVNELAVSVMTLNPPVVFNHENHDPVSLIFCLAAIDNHAHLKMMSTIVKLINEEGKIEELSKCDTLEKFKEELFKLEG